MSNELYIPSVTKEIVSKYGFKFSKSLGQNFLVDGNIIRNICEGANITEEDGIIEIGPGIGTLTQQLSKYAKKVVAIELDKKLLPILEETLSECENVKVINEDVLKVDLERLIEEEFKGLNVKVVANLPYYITTPIIMKLLESKLDIQQIVVMIQKEVALRMQANPGNKDYGALSIAVQYYSQPEIIANVPASVFIPRPNVDSAVIMLSVYDEPKVKVKDEKLMFNVVKSAFGQRRKTLLNALSGGNLNLTKEEVSKVLEEANIDPKKRGEVLAIEDFVNISDKICSLKK
ncbi:dimethyladenosine transferase KsgA [Gottschalkia acidurici 9a]|uniref:Ribosomal RNA small subunit methyltransferase A n=1 Tax=Gottschalkia acidurici (strain ATCC 7906 / DSM 604 / BCRC 14475 / CIP 104303 / KCTC 5404 / NCIMB 10678 / 9a) TaxID=1128398 RepID=K0AWQ2_GOTA9|nr:16S rRNA (adenine(1518)-N(6)/adenine(1519)-N(6))-dimethyltransferase RsmA [Gottschalkia acidurici]AFS77207.1 dimethyladenosine transferase KsgA [Gottschalkia acidurici 9a]